MGRWQKIIALIVLIAFIFFILSGCRTAERTQPEDEIPVSADLLVIGDTLAALVAALEAVEQGGEVILLASMDFAEVGRDALFMFSEGFIACDSLAQQKMGIEFSVVELVQLMQEHGRNINDRKLLRSFAENTGQAVSWLENEWGFTFKLSSIDKPHLHLPEPELNAALFVDTLQHGLLSRININEHFFSGELEKVSRLNKGQGFKVFISTEEKQIELFVRALLFADGGFAGNEQLLTEFAPGQSGLRTDLRPDSTGKGLLFLKEADADLLQLDLIDAVPVYVEDGRFMLFQPPSEAYYLNSYGELIAEDEDGAQQLRRLIYSQPNRTVYLVVNDEVLPHQLRFANFFRPLLTFEQLAEYMKLEEEKAELLERNLRSLKVPFWVAKTELAVKYTLGGVKISPKGEVISGGRPLPGVFAAGEIIGGLHGERILEGAALSEAVVTARIAAKAAAEWARR